MTSQRLKGKVAVVTGASRGLGKFYALALAEAGAKIVVASRSDTQARLSGTIHETVDEIRKLGGEALALRCDVASPRDIHAVIGEAVYRFGGIDIIVNNAANAQRIPFFNITPEVWDDYFHVNTRAAFLTAQAAAPHMMRRGGGSIINITSGAATSPVDDSMLAHHGLYMMTKSALNRTSVYLSQELASFNIAVNALSPGAVSTEGLIDRVPKGNRDRSGIDWREPSVELVRDSIVELASQDAKGITGQIMHVSQFPLKREA